MPRLDPPLRRTHATPIYPIGAASRLSGIPVWTLRALERSGVVHPRRSGGRHRLYSEAQLERLREVRSLLERGVNLPGVSVIMSRRLPRA